MSNSNSSLQRLLRALAGIAVLALLASACSSADDTDDAADDAAAATDSTDGAVDEVVEEAPTLTRGGSLTVLLEAESDTWDIPNANCAVSCINVMRAVADPLMIIDENGLPQPYLLSDYTMNEDFTVHTMTMRDGITFHDGTPADGAALQKNMAAMAFGLLQGQVLLDLADGFNSIELIDPMTVQITFSRPLATFPYVLAERTGWLIASSYWDNPDRASALMVATGPFMMTEWTRNEQTVLTANPNYWKKDANGEALPYLDEVIFRPNPDVAGRRATMESGDAQLNIDSFGENKAFWTEEWEGGLVDTGTNREVTYLLLNNETGPFADPEMRRAVALCTDRDQYLQFRAPQNQKINGPFAEGAAGYLADPGFPDFDPVAGNALLDQIGRPEVINYGTTNVPSNLLTAELFVEQWSTNCGLNVNIDQFDQSELITKAITGQFEAFLWRNHGQGNPGLEFVWWHSRHAEGLALNFGRIVDPNLDSLLEQVAATDDPAELDRLGQEINQLFGENVYNLWLNTNEWFLPYPSDVHGVGTVNLPDGGLAEPSVAGRTWVTEAWIEG